MDYDDLIKKQQGGDLSLNHDPSFKNGCRQKEDKATVTLREEEVDKGKEGFEMTVRD